MSVFRHVNKNEEDIQYNSLDELLKIDFVVAISKTPGFFQFSVSNNPLFKQDILMAEYRKGLDWGPVGYIDKDSITAQLPVWEPKYNMPHSDLSEKEQKLIGLSLFSMSMKIGPSSFPMMEVIIDKIGVRAQFEFFAHDWIEYANWFKTKPDE
jgi:hypothetical protein